MMKMIARGCVGLVVLVNFVVSMPVTPGHMDQKDVKVMKCIVELIADVLTKPHPIPVSPDCLQTLSTDDRLVTLLRHRNFLQELQDIAAEGANERAQKHPGDLLHVTSLPEETKKTADDQSMLVAMEKPEEKRRGSEESSRESEESEKESQKRNNIAEEEENEEDDNLANHISMNPEQKRESQEEVIIKDKDESFEKEENDLTHPEEVATLTDALEANPDAKQSIKEVIAEPRGAEKELSHSKEEQKDVVDEEEKRAVGAKPWTRISKLAHKRVETGQKLEERMEASQHSKERMDQEGELWRSPEEHELQLMAQTEPEDKRDEEGSASRKTEDADIESLAVIESELESVAQKLHELRRG